jgi:hypothetical protein
MSLRTVCAICRHREPPPDRSICDVCLPPSESELRQRRADRRHYGATVIESEHTGEEMRLALCRAVSWVIDDVGVDGADLRIHWTWSRRYVAGPLGTLIEHVLLLEAALPG